MKANLKRTLQVLIAVLCLATAIIASAGSLNYAHIKGEGIYTLFGAMNFLVGGYAFYNILKVIRNS